MGYVITRPCWRDMHCAYLNDSTCRQGGGLTNRCLPATENVLSRTKVVSSRRPIAKAHVNERRARAFVAPWWPPFIQPSVVSETEGGQINLAAGQNCSCIDSYLGTDCGQAGNRSHTRSAQLPSVRPPAMSVVGSSSSVPLSSRFGLQVSL